MKKKFYILMCCLTGLAMIAACSGEKVKEKLHAVAKSVADRKKAGPSLSTAQEKALDKENPWFARDFRMELTAQTMGSNVNVELQKSADVLYYHFWNKSGDTEMLVFLGEEEYKIYRISTKAKVAQLTGTSKPDYYRFFSEKIGDLYGIVHKAREEKKKSKSDNAFVESDSQESLDVKDERWNGFDCEKIIRITETENDLSAGMKALGGLLGNKGELENSMKDLKKIKQTDIVWIDKKSGAVVHREYKMEGGAGLGTMAEQMKGQPSVTLLTFSPDPSLIPTSLEGYKLVQ